jgi:hypothetical protein
MEKLLSGVEGGRLDLGTNPNRCLITKTSPKEERYFLLL